jgi:hypothetical protein
MNNTKYENNYKSNTEIKLDDIETNINNIPDESIIYLQNLSKQYLKNMRELKKNELNKPTLEEAKDKYDEYHKSENYDSYNSKYCENNIKSASNDKIIYKLISLGYGYHEVKAYDNNNNYIGIVESFHE